MSTASALRPRRALLCLLAALRLGAQEEAWEQLRDRAARAGQEGRFREAEALLRAQLERAQSREQRDHTARDLAEFYQLQGRSGEAERFWRWAVELREAAEGPDSPEVAGPLLELGRNLLVQAHAPDAAGAVELALAVLEKAHGAEALETVPALALLAQVHQARDDWAAAEVLLLRAVRIREARQGPEAVELATELTGLGKFYQQRNRWMVAEPQLFPRPDHRTPSAFSRSLSRRSSTRG